MRLLIIFTFLFTFTYAQDDSEWKGCPYRVLSEMVDGKEIQVNRFINPRLSQKKNDRGQVGYGASQKSLLGSTDDAIIGFDQNSHTYDRIKNARHDGHHLGKGTAKVPARFVDQGNFMTLDGLSDAQKDGLYQVIVDQTNKIWLFQTSCIRSTCSNVEKGAGLRLKGGKPWLPSEIFKRMIHDGFVDKDGNPVKVTYYSVEGKTFQETLDRLQVREREILLKIGRWAGGVAVTAVVAVVGNEVRKVVFIKEEN